MQVSPIQPSQPVPPNENIVSAADETCDAFLLMMEPMDAEAEIETVSPEIDPDLPEVDVESEPDQDAKDCDALVDGVVQFVPIQQTSHRSVPDEQVVGDLDLGHSEPADKAPVKIERTAFENDVKLVVAPDPKANADTIAAIPDRPEVAPPIQPERAAARPDAVPKMLPNPTEAQVIKQVLSAPLSDGNVTEIALDPEELGRVRMQMITHESSVQIVIAAERPETADLMRKHLDLLASDFKDMGFGDVNLEFASHDDSENRHQNGGHSTAESDETEIIQPILRHSDGRVDIRL